MPARILVIDDDPVQRELVSVFLEDHRILEAATGEEGLQSFAASSFDLVICDLKLPGISGFDVIRRVRELQPAQRILVISAYGTPGNLVATLRQSVVDFVVKPYTRDELQQAVKNLLGSQHCIQVLSANERWIELRVPARFQVAASLSNFFGNLQADVDEPTRARVGIAFHELLNNAIEHGCKGDPEGMIQVCYVRMKHAIVYRIQDPGGGFDFGCLAHAAIANPPEEPIKHLELREQKGMRPGGFGLLWIQNIADELIFNDRRNDVLFVKYLEPPPAAGA